MDLGQVDTAHQREQAGLKVDGRFVPTEAALREFGSGNLAVGVGLAQAAAFIGDFGSGVNKSALWSMLCDGATCSGTERTAFAIRTDVCCWQARLPSVSWNYLISMELLGLSGVSELLVLGHIDRATR